MLVFAIHLRLGGGLPFVVTGGKYNDIYHAYDQQSVVFFDWPRSQEEAFPYSVVETFKNGYFLSTIADNNGLFTSRLP